MKKKIPGYDMEKHTEYFANGDFEKMEELTAPYEKAWSEVIDYLTKTPYSAAQYQEHHENDASYLFHIISKENDELRTSCFWHNNGEDVALGHSILDRYEIANLPPDVEVEIFAA